MRSNHRAAACAALAAAALVLGGCHWYHGGLSYRASYGTGYYDGYYDDCGPGRDYGYYSFSLGGYGRHHDGHGYGGHRGGHCD